MIEKKRSLFVHVKATDPSECCAYRFPLASDHRSKNFRVARRIVHSKALYTKAMYAPPFLACSADIPVPLNFSTSNGRPFHGLLGFLFCT